MNVLTNTHISLGYEDFRCLVRGGVLTIGSIKIILQDIGFREMKAALEDAIDGIDTYKDRSR